MENEKKVLFSGIQPSGILTLGNYLGAIKSWQDLQNEFNCIFSVVDMHAITVPQEPAKLRANTLELLSLYIAAGIDPEKSIMFVQSHVHEHAELAWVLDNVTYIGELSRMTQFKDKSKKQADGNINMGLMNYPVLMAADILLYNVDLVPVGADQRQHLELTRDVAIRFNNRYSDTFKVPEGYFPKAGARVMSLCDPSQKMSKSDKNVNAFISMTDDRETIIRKFKRAVTDSGDEIRYAENKPGISNLIAIYACTEGLSVQAVEERFQGVGYGEFKEAVGESVANTLVPISQRQKQLLTDKATLLGILERGRDNASQIAARTLGKVYRKIGFLQLGK